MSSLRANYGCFTYFDLSFDESSDATTIVISLLAATLARGVHTVDTWSAFFCTIHQDPVLQRVRLIAEPWDTGTNGYQVGNFPSHWSEWNDKYRETVRRFWRQEPTALPDLAFRLTGSVDLFQGDGRTPSASINYIASHDGLTLADLAESSATLQGLPPGAERDEARRRLQRNLLATLLLSMRPDAHPLDEEDWKAPRAHLALVGTLDGQEALLLLNASDDAVRYTMPGQREQPWKVAVQTDCDDGSVDTGRVTDRVDVPGRAVILLVRRHGEGEA